MRPGQSRTQLALRHGAQVSAAALMALLAACATAAPGAPGAPGIVSTAAAQAQLPLYKDATQPVEARVEDLLSRMTLEEKIVQITTVWNRKATVLDADTRFDPRRASELFPGGIGHFARPNDRTGGGNPLLVPFRGPRETVELTNAIQKWAMEETRLGIPVLFHEEGLHGYAAPGATAFPQAIALASTWDPDLIERVYSVVAREIRARGAHLVLSPVVDVARDPRWGRFEETYGEDPYLVSEMGVAAVIGFQGDTLPLGEGKVFATLKHMTGHGQPESGTNVGPAALSERLLREVFFPPFEQVVNRTDIRAVMASYNEIDGVPSHANSWLLNGVLRGEWGFAGAVVSDYWGIDDLVRLHGVEPDLQSAAVRALKAGVDFDLPDGQGYSTLPDALAAGLITEADIDRAVRRMLTMKFEAGLFENPYADADYAEQITDNAEARALALEAARKSIILLKNDGVLPLDKGQLDQIAVIGPNADAIRLGGYSDVPNRVVTMLDGIRAEVGSEARTIYHVGVELTEQGDWWTDEVILADRDENLARIDVARRAVADADVILLFIGGSEATRREAYAANHPGDRTSIDLVGEQLELARAMFETGKPVVVILINGRPLGIEEVTDRASAVIEGWYLGQEGGTAMADVLFGKVNPGGKLPVTIPRNVGQLPLVYNHKPSALRGYLFDTTAPLFPFGYGLSYTSFSLSAPRLSATSTTADAGVTVSVDVTNTGDRAGDEVVQLYLRDKVSAVTRPVKELRGFQRVTLAPGQSRTVTFELDREDFQYFGPDMTRIVEPGEFDIMVGPNSVDLKTVTLTVE